MTEAWCVLVYARRWSAGSALLSDLNGEFFGRRSSWDGVCRALDLMVETRWATALLDMRREADVTVGGVEAENTPNL